MDCKDKKKLILIKLNSLKKLYENKEDKIWNLKAITNAIRLLDKYKGTIISGKQLQNEIKGIGTKISTRIDEILETGDLKELCELDKINDKNKYLNNLLDITGVGLVRAKKWLELDIKDINDVVNAVKDKKITTTHHIDIGIKYYNDLKEKIPRNEIDKIKIIIEKNLKSIDNHFLFEICGSYRRGLKESGDIDILITNTNYINNISTQNYLNIIVQQLKDINFITDSLTEKGSTKYMGICKLNKSSIGRRIDIRVVDYQSYYAALLYFTGNKNFNIYIRNEALKYNYSLNEYGMSDMRDNSIIFTKSEEDIFKMLKISYMKPEERNEL